MTVAFDIDDTLWKIVPDKCPNTDPGIPQLVCLCGKHWKQVPDYDLIQVLKWFHSNGDTIYFWSAGGMDYCQVIVDKLGLNTYGTVIEKGSIRPDLAFDDAETGLATVDIKVNRESRC